MVQKTLDKGTQMAGFVKMWVIKEKEKTRREVRWKGGREESGRSKQEGRSDSDQNTVYTIY